MRNLLRYNTIDQEVHFSLMNPITGDFITDSDAVASEVKDDAYISKNSGSFVLVTGALTYLDKGVWVYVPVAADVTARTLVISIIDTNGTKRWADYSEKWVMYNHGLAEFGFDFSSQMSAQQVDSVINGVTLVNDAITAAKIAENAIGSSQIADAAISAAKIAENAIRVAHIQDNTITAAKIATDAIGASEISQAALDQVWTSATRSLTAAVDVNKINGVTLAAQLLSLMYSGAMRGGTIPSTWSDAITGVHGLGAIGTAAFVDAAMVWTTGANKGHTPRRVSSHDGTDITVSLAFNNTPQSGDQFLLLGKIA